MTGGTYEEDFCNKIKQKYNLKFLDSIVFRKTIDEKIFMYMIFKHNDNTEKEIKNFKLKIGNKHISNLHYDTIFDIYDFINICEIPNIYMKKIFENITEIPYDDIILNLNIIESKPIIINSKRCIIRPIQKNDYNGLLPVWTDPYNIQQHGVIWTERSVQYICENTEPLQICTDGNFSRKNVIYDYDMERYDLFTGVYFSVELFGKSAEIVGCIVINKVSDDLYDQLLSFGETVDIGHSVDIGYAYNKKYHGNGYATEVLNAILHFITENNEKLQINTVYGDAIEHNIGSQRVMEKNGFIKIGEAPFLYMNEKGGFYYKKSIN